MREPAPRAPFDQGLFLAHYNKGKELYDQQKFAEAEGQLEEAYLLRPRDAKVLNLLGLVYFRQEKLEKAEEVYRKLILDSPEAPTLRYNLGLVYFKLERWDESETEFTKALELAGENPKINFYLGSIYERLHRFQDAIFQYRQAGANIMVRRVEDKLAAEPTRPRGKPKGDDTAEFKAGDVRKAIEQAAVDVAAFGSRPVQQVSPSLLAEGAPGKKSNADTAKFLVRPSPGGGLPQISRVESGPSVTLPPDAGAAASLGAHTLPGPMPSPFFTPRPVAATTGPQTQPVPPPPEIPSEVPGLFALPPAQASGFHLLRPNLLEVNFAGKLFIKQGTIYTYGGNLTFWVKEPKPGGRPPLVIVTGTGKLLLTDRDRQIVFLQVQDETIFVESNHLLACEEGLAPRFVGLGDRADVIALDGSGVIALSVATRPLALSVSPDMPVVVPAASVISWSGSVIAQIVEDRQVYQVMAPTAAQNPVLRLEGSGRLIVEQS
jgi:Flp pilus assembly protein TadD